MGQVASALSTGQRRTVLLLLRQLKHCSTPIREGGTTAVLAWTLNNARRGRKAKHAHISPDSIGAQATHTTRAPRALGTTAIDTAVPVHVGLIAPTHKLGAPNPSQLPTALPSAPRDDATPPPGRRLPPSPSFCPDAARGQSHNERVHPTSGASRTQNWLCFTWHIAATDPCAQAAPTAQVTASSWRICPACFDCSSIS
jgi:hypothetical protein